jgi:hypothetical protein
MQKIQDSRYRRFKIRDAEDTGFKMQKIQDSRCRRFKIQDAEDTGFKMQKIQDSRCRRFEMQKIPDSGYRRYRIQDADRSENWENPNERREIQNHVSRESGILHLAS